MNNDIKMYLREMGCETVDWIHLKTAIFVLTALRTSNPIGFIWLRIGSSGGLL
jgi:hypothetical protein